MLAALPAAATAAGGAAPAAIPAWLDYAALVVGSLYGGLAATTRRLDLVGHVGLALICGLGGGLIRDSAMQVGSVYMLSDPYAIAVSVAAGVVAFLFPGVGTAHPHLLEWLDIVSVGLFCASGTDKAVAYALNPWAIVLMGTLTGVGGGMLRDVFLGEVPQIFQRSNLYATCAIAGSVTYYLADGVVHGPKYAAAFACVVVCVALRRWSLRFNVKTATGVDLEPRVRNASRSVSRRVRGERGGNDARPGGEDGARAGRSEGTQGGGEGAVRCDNIRRGCRPARQHTLR